MKEIDCALIFMLDEEKELFLKYNKEFIITNTNDVCFSEFIFFDKNMLMRTGVIVSNGKKMGNTEACALFYKLTRHYKAKLYINLGVAGLMSEMNIGDVLIATRISTMGENNANNKKKLPKDLSLKEETANYAYNGLYSFIPEFSKQSEIDVKILKENFQNIGINLNKYNGIANFKNNNIITGWCLTVPEVIKNRSIVPELEEYRHLNLFDMEAYYIGLWHALIHENEPKVFGEPFSSEFIAFKSVSDYGDENKKAMEECGSRELAMKNLYTVVSTYCTNVYEFRCTTSKNIYTYFNENISESCLDLFIKQNNNCYIKDFEEFFQYIIYADSDSEFNSANCIQASIDIITQEKKALFLFGRSGTGKSTFMSYLFQETKKKGYDAVLIDFSKYSKYTSPSDSQLLALLKKLLVSEKKVVFFLDGIDTSSNSYSILRKILENCDIEYPELSFCIGNIKEEDNGELYDTISSEKIIVDLSFNGISVYSPFFDSFIEKSKLLFNNKNYDIEIIKKFVIESNVSNVDFRLLSMFANYGNNLSAKKCLHTFVKDYLNNKYRKKLEYCKYFAPFEFETTENLQNIEEVNKIQKNSYFNCLGIAIKIIDIFEVDDAERINKFFQHEYILSDDINLMFEHLLKQKRNYNEIIGKILSYLTKKTPSISVETQLIYNISRISTSKKDNPYNEKIKCLAIQRHANAEKLSHNKLINIEHINWLIEYRTLSIVLAKCYCNESALYEYNERMLQEEESLLRSNLIFHLFYYSKRNFSFNKIFEFSLYNTDYEMFCSTYYKLKHSFNLNKNSLWLMNAITFLYLIEELIVKRKMFMSFSDDSKESLSNVLLSLKSPNFFGEYCDLEKMIIKIEKVIPKLTLNDANAATLK